MAAPLDCGVIRVRSFRLLLIEGAIPIWLRPIFVTAPVLFPLKMELLLAVVTITFSRFFSDFLKMDVRVKVSASFR